MLLGGAISLAAVFIPGVKQALGATFFSAILAIGFTVLFGGYFLWYLDGE